MTHTASEAAGNTPRNSVELTAHAGVRLAFPRLSAERPAIVEPLAAAIDASYREHLLAMSPTISTPTLAEAIGLVYGELQQLLADLEGQRLEGAWRRELWDAQAQCQLALPGQRGLAKRLQVAASAGRPLTVCFGKRARTVLTPAGPTSQVYPFGDGCGLVHPDSTGQRRPCFRLYCHHCRKLETARQNAAHLAAIHQWQGREPVLADLDNTNTPTPAWHGHCTSCGNPFVTVSARTTRCERCADGHR